MQVSAAQRDIPLRIKKPLKDEIGRDQHLTFFQFTRKILNTLHGKIYHDIYILGGACFRVGHHGQRAAEHIFRTGRFDGIEHEAGKIQQG